MPNTPDITALRPPKMAVEADVPYAFLHEREPDAQGLPKEVNTLFLTNKECPFRCVMCDLWKHTLDGPTPSGAVLRQIDHALARLPEASVIKLYNSGNFFDGKAVPPEEHRAIAERLNGYERVIVENHPSLIGARCLAFSEMLSGQLEVAMGLECIHPEVWPKLNKQMRPSDFKEAAGFLTAHGIAVRTFILINPPYLLGETENIEWALKAVAYAFDAGSECAVLIPTRTGNGAMEVLEREGHYVPPTWDVLETVFDRALGLGRGRVFLDLWDIERFSGTAECIPLRKARLERMNATQRVEPRIDGKTHG